MTNIVVLIKQVPDTWSERKLTDGDYTLDREAADAEAEPARRLRHGGRLGQSGCGGQKRGREAFEDRHLRTPVVVKG